VHYYELGLPLCQLINMVPFTITYQVGPRILLGRNVGGVGGGPGGSLGGAGVSTGGSGGGGRGVIGTDGISSFGVEAGMPSPFGGDTGMPSPFGGDTGMPSPVGGDTGMPSPFGGETGMRDSCISSIVSSGAYLRGLLRILSTIPPVISEIVNSCLANGTFPSDLKSASLAVKTNSEAVSQVIHS
jgi:hypothetical protein